MQRIDARDLAAFMVHLLERDTPGVFHAVGPDHPWTWGEWMALCQEAAGTPSTLRWVGDDFLKAHGVTGAELPFWIAPPDENLFAVDVGHGVAAGLCFRPELGTARDTLAWRGEVGVEDLAAGMTPGRERALLAEAAG